MKKITSISKLSSLLAFIAFLAVPSVVLAKSDDVCVSNGMTVVSQVKNALDSDPMLKKYDLNVSTSRSDNIRLSGTVLWGADKEEASRVAQQVCGAGRISNNIGISDVTDGFVGG